MLVTVVVLLETIYIDFYFANDSHSEREHSLPRPSCTLSQGSCIIELMSLLLAKWHLTRDKEKTSYCIEADVLQRP